MHYNRDVRARYVVEQPDLPDLLKLMSRRTTCTSGGRRRANGFKTAEEDFWWACGLCFFERRKKSTVKAHVTQRVCQKTSLRKEMRQRRKALGHLKRYASCEFSTEGFEDIEPLAWNSPLSVQLNQMVLLEPSTSDCVPTLYSSKTVVSNKVQDRSRSAKKQMQIILRVITDLDLSKRSRLTAKMFQLHMIYCTILIFLPNTRIVAYCSIVHQHITET